jgi:anaerobic magnesium-protoporphyrin IX monomethyl ester cyclase
MFMEEYNVQRNVMFIVLPYLVREAEAKNSKIRSFTAFPYGLLSVATYLKNNSCRKINIQIIDCNLYTYEESVQIIKRSLLDFKPDIAGLSMMFDSSYKYLRDISKLIKDNSHNSVVVLGGSAASFSYPEIINEQDYIDGICYSEGEIPLVRLVDSEDMLELMDHDVSWITKKSVKEGKNPKKSFITDLNNVVHIDYSFVDIENYPMKEAFSPFINDDYKNKKQFFLVTSRGCPYKCIFCSTSSTLYGNQIRYADVDNIIAHVKHLVSCYHMNVLTIYDDQLLSNKERAKELFRQLAQFKLRIECPNGLSVAFIDDEMASLMRSAGMDTAILAIESGSDYMLKEVIHKPLKLQMVKPVVQILRKHGFFIQGFFVIGIPGEREEHRDETLHFIKDVGLDWSGFSLATPLRGSRLYDICIKNGYINRNLKIGEIEDKKYIIKTPELDPEYITKKTYLMNLDVNFVNNYRMKTGDYKVAANCFQDVTKRYEDHAFAYYYLAKAQEAMNENPELIKSNKKKFREIIQNDNTWKEYVDYYGLDRE